MDTAQWVTPLLLLPGVALLVLSTSVRLGQLHTEIHHLSDAGKLHGEVAQHMRKRIALFRQALVGLYSAVALLCMGGLVGGLVFLWEEHSVRLVLGLSTLGVGSAVFSAVTLVRESTISMRIIEHHFDSK